MRRLLYGILVACHPPAFRRRFGGEMRLIFDESPGREAPRLFGDVLASLLRQWLVRSGVWKLPLAAAGGLLAPLLGLTMLPLLRIRTAVPKDDTLQELMLLVAMVSLLVIGMTTTLCVFWFRFFKKRRA